MKKRTKLTVIEIDWVDSSATRGWHAVDKVDTLARIKSIGLLVGETPEALIISTSRSRNGIVMDQLAIPKGAVVWAKRSFIMV